MTAIIAQYVGFSTLKHKVKLAKIKDKEVKYESQYHHHHHHHKHQGLDPLIRSVSRAIAALANAF